MLFTPFIRSKAAETRAAFFYEIDFARFFLYYLNHHIVSKLQYGTRLPDVRSVHDTLIFQRRDLMIKFFFQLLMLITLLGLFASPARPNGTNGQNASLVIGQPNFTSGAAGLSATTLNTPNDVVVDLAHGKLYVLEQTGSA